VDAYKEEPAVDIGHNREEASSLEVDGSDKGHNNWFF
jgi:hypothetical protein